MYNSYWDTLYRYKTACKIWLSAILSSKPPNLNLPVQEDEHVTNLLVEDEPLPPRIPLSQRINPNARRFSHFDPNHSDPFKSIYSSITTIGITISCTPNPKMALESNSKTLYPTHKFFSVYYFRYSDHSGLIALAFLSPI